MCWLPCWLPGVSLYNLKSQIAIGFVIGTGVRDCLLFLLRGSRGSRFITRKLNCCIARERVWNPYFLKENRETSELDRGSPMRLVAVSIQ